MTTRTARDLGGDPDAQAAGHGSGWAAAVPEIWIAAIAVACAAVTGYAAAGLAGTAVVMTVAAVAALAVERVIGPGAGARPDDGRLVSDDLEAIPGTFSGYWRRRAGLADATESLPAYDAGLRATLQHLLAARLAERHGVSLHHDPAAARRLLCPHRRDENLWYWVDPARPATPAGTQRGIPPRTLALLIDRLERL
jgi:hypothetical protein